jgi:heptosyltransferase-2
LGRALRVENYRYAWVLPNSFKSALTPFFAGIPRRVGFTGEARWGLLNVRYCLDRSALPRMVDRFYFLGQGMDPAANEAERARSAPAPRLVSTVAQQLAAWHEIFPSDPFTDAKSGIAPPVILCPGAEYGAAKRWPVEHFAALAGLLMMAGRTILLMGSGKDRAIGDAIGARLPPGLQSRCHNLCGRTRLDQAIDLIAASAFVVCNDSGLMHVAAALGRPLVALFGSSSPEFTPPLSQQATVLHLELPCRPCFKRTCPLGTLACLAGLAPERVLAACRALPDVALQ